MDGGLRMLELRGTSDRMTFAEQLQERIERLAAKPGYRNYLATRERVLAMREQPASLASDVPSHYWEEELEGFEYLLDASPLLIDRLLHHSYHITGTRVYDYRSEKDEQQKLFAEKYAALAEIGDPRLFVPQTRELGGYGFDIAPGLTNVDTLKFFEVLIGMDKAGFLPGPGGEEERRTVLEIGAGWGGFAHAYKTLFPNTTYAIIDLPEVMLFSGTYLQTLFPEAKCLFFDPAAPPPGGDWSEYDFVFFPHTALENFRPDRLDLAVNMVSFQEMTDAQCRGYVEAVHALGCPRFYSLNRDRSPYNPQMTSVSDIIGESYETSPIEILDVPYTKMLNIKKKNRIATETTYRHLAGRSRSQTGLAKKQLIGWLRGR